MPISTPIDPQSLYFQLRQHIEQMPEEFSYPLPLESRKWLAKAHALVNATGVLAGNALEAKDLKDVERSIDFGSGDGTQGTISGIMCRAFYAAELQAPASMQGAFIPVGNAFDAIAAIGKVLQTAKQDIMIVDPYLDDKVLTEFAPLAPEQVTIRILTDEKDHKASLKPVIKAWLVQNGSARPLEVRLLPHRELHDRILIIDGKAVWSLSQSLNAFAGRSHASIQIFPPEVTARKLEAYEPMWHRAKPFVI